MRRARVAQRILTGETFGMMLPKNSPWLERVNGAITEIKEDGTMAEIYRKWLEAEPSEGTSTLTVLPIPQAE